METILATTTTSDVLGLIGGALTAIGILLMLVGTRLLRSILARMRPRPVKVATGAGRVEAVVSARARGRSGPPDGVITLEWLAENHQKQIDELSQELDKHAHPQTEHRIKSVQRNVDAVRESLDRRIDDLDGDTQTVEHWNVAGLVVAGIGALFQVAAIFA